MENIAMKKIATPHFDFESKKEYMHPEVLVVPLNAGQQMLAGSVTGLVDTGLEDNLVLPGEDGDAWDDAMSRESDGFNDEYW